MDGNMTNISHIIAEFAAGRNCAQYVLGCWANELGYDQSETDAMAACFGAGGGTGDICGAVTGAYMVLGIACDADHAVACRKAAEFREQFQEQFGSCICNKLLGIEMSNPEECVKSSGLIAERCTWYIKKAVEIVAGLL